jgi:bifunctional hydroxylase/dehydrase
MDSSVIVVGAGPAGLMLAGELRLGGVDVVVLDRLPRRTGESRGIGLTVRTVEVFDQRGLLPRFGDLQESPDGHFGGIPLDLGLAADVHLAARTVPQSAVEEVLEAWARELGADIRRGHEVRAVRDLGDAVEVDVHGPAETHTFRGRYLVGCDGGRSTVRRQAGFDFPGSDATTELFLADLRGVDLDPKTTGDVSAGGMVMVGKLPNGITRVIVGEHGAPPRKRTGPPAFDEVADAWKRLTDIDISHAEPVWVSAFTDAARQVTEYRRGRTLLAGDAAHVHLPAGGQGMNVSVQDSVNLAWKLAAVVRGTASQSLVDSYHTERHEVGRQLLLNTQAQSQLILGGVQAAPLRTVLSELVAYPEVARHLAAKVSGLDIRYDVGRGIDLLGRRLPQLKLTGPRGATTSTRLLHRARGVLLDLADNAVLRGRAAGWTDRVDVATAGVDPAGPLPGVTAVLLRPDGHVAWAAPGAHSDLPMALNRWFGPERK